MLKSKIKKLICLVFALMCIVPCCVVSASAKAEEPDYPCYCENCVEQWNSMYCKQGFNGFSAGNTRFNGYNLLVFGFPRVSYSDALDSFRVFFYKDFSFEFRDGYVEPFLILNDVYFSNKLSVSDYSSVDLSSIDFSFSSSLEYRISFYGVDTPYSLIENAAGRPYVVGLYCTFTCDYWVGRGCEHFYKSSFTYPQHILTDSEYFELNFSDYLFSWISGVYRFVIDNTLVLIVFAIALIGAVVSIVKRASR